MASLREIEMHIAVSKAAKKKATAKLRVPARLAGTFKVDRVPQGKGARVEVEIKDLVRPTSPGAPGSVLVQHKRTKETVRPQDLTL